MHFGLVYAVCELLIRISCRIYGWYCMSSFMAIVYDL
jgi:hypothetical protein